MKLTEQQGFILLGASPALALGLGIGLAAGLFIANKKLENKYLEISNREIAEAKQFYSILNKKDDFKTPEAAVETLGLEKAVTALQTYQGEYIFDEVEEGVRDTPVDADDELREQDNTPTSKFNFAPKAPIDQIHIQSISIDAVADPNRGPIEIVKHNIFADNQSDEDVFDYDEELKHRGDVEPYIISRDEFMENESENIQNSLTYYEGDGVLTDEKEQPIPDVDETVGEDNLQRFGYGSMDPRVVYIHNPRIDVDFEVNQSQGKYTEEVLGFLEHAEHRPFRRFRGDDE